MARLRTCKVCGTPFSGRSDKQYCSSSCRYVSFVQGKENTAAEPCVYCGFPADTIDHIPPQSMRAKLFELGLQDRWPYFEVSACHECNSLLGAIELLTVVERREYLKDKFIKRYKHILSTANFTEEELEEMSPMFRKNIESSMLIKRLIEQRLEWLSTGGTTKYK